MLKYLLAIIIILPAAASLAQDSFPRIDSAALPGAAITTSRTFKGQALFGYIDGGAELYLEYGFDEARITELTLKGEKYKVEIFKMNGPEEAFGIFSVSRFNCRSTTGISGFTCQAKYQLQVCRGSFYISIIGRKGNQADSLNMLELGKQISSGITGPDADLASYIPGVASEAGQLNCFLAKGRLGIVNGSPDLEDYFSGITGYSALVMNKDNHRIISIKFDSAGSMEDFLKLHSWDLKLLTGNPLTMQDGEQVSKLAEKHLFIVTSD